MTQIDYETSQYSSQRQNIERKESFLISLVLRTGIVKSKKQANIVLLIMTGIFFLATLIVLSANGTFSSSNVSSTDTDIDYTGSEYFEEEYVDIE